MDDGRMDEERIDPEVTEMLRGRYNPPPATPREEMWAAIQARLEPRTATVHSLEEARAKRRPASWRRLGWLAAAAAVLVLGIGIGRMSAPTGPGAAPVAAFVTSDPGVQRAAAVNHLGRTRGPAHAGAGRRP